MKFSIIVATFNRLSLLRKCLNSLETQDFPKSEFEIIVVDDASSDGTAEFLQQHQAPNFKFRLNSQNFGPARSRNQGASKSQGQYLAFTDDDCLVPPNWLKLLKEGLEKWPQAGAVGGFLEAPEAVLKVNKLAQLEAWETHGVYKAGDTEYLGGFESPAGGTNNIAYRREVFERLGGFDENFPVQAGEDADLKWRAVLAGFKIGYRPIKVTHLDPYNFSSFVRRSVFSGMGSVYFEAKNSGRLPSLLEEFFKLLKTFLRLLLVPFWSLKISQKSLSKSLSYLMLVRSLLMSFGRLKFIKKSKIN